MKRRFTILTAALALLVSLAIPMGVWGQQTATYSLTPDQQSTGSNSTSYITTLTEFTYGGVTWKMNQWNPSTLQIKTNQSSATSEFRFYNNSAFEGRITKVVLKFSALTLSNTSNTGFMFVGGTSAITATTGGTAGVWNSNEKTITWTPSASDNYTYFAFYQNGKVATGTNKLATADAIVVTYETSGGTSPTLSVDPSSISFGQVTINPTSAYEGTFEVSFANLTQNLTITGFAGVTVSPSSIASSAPSPATVTVSYNPTAEGTLSGNITVSNTADNLSETVAVTGSAYDPENVDTYELYNGTIVEGDYVICYEGQAMKNTVSSNRLGYMAVTPINDEIVNPSASIVWHIAQSGNYWTIYNENVNKYAAGTTSKNQATLLDEATSDLAKWIIPTPNSGSYNVENYGRANESDPNNKFLRYNSGYGYACYASGTGGSLSFYKKVDSGIATTTTINVPDNFNTDIYQGTTAGTLTATVSAEGTPISGATVTWSSSNTDVATIDANGEVTLVAVGTTTITASYAGVEDEYRPSTGTYELTVTDSNAPGTENNPYTVAQAIANTPSVGNVYIQGIVSSFYNTSIVGDGSNYRYYISDDGTTTTQLLVYKGKGLNQATFTNATDLLVGDEVVIYGSLITYQNAPEVASGNYLYSWNRPTADVEAPTFSPVAGTYTETQNVNISCATTGANIYYTTDGTEPTSASTPYTSAIAVSTTTTIKAIAYVGNTASTVAAATYHFCSAEDPYTVTEALAFNEYPANGIYVHGIVSTAPTQAPTSNGELTYYISVDGNATNQLEVYKGKNLEQAAFTAQDDIQVGDVVTVYGNVVIYNNTKEFAQGNYLVSFERPAQQYTLTVNCSANVEIYTFIGDSTDPGVEGATTQQVSSGTEVGISVSATTGYILTLMVDGTDVTSQLDETGYYTFEMPTHNVTVTATASAAPVVTTNTYTLATSIESGKTYIIVGKKDGDYYAMGKQNQNNRAAVQIISDGTTATATIGSEDDVFEFVIEGNATDGYTFYDGVTPGYLYAASSSSNYLRTQVENDNNGIWDITYSNEEECPSVVARGTNSRKVMQFNNSSVLFACYGSASQHAVYLYVKYETPVTETFTKHIIGYEDTEHGGNGTGNYYLIASPIGNVAPANVANMINLDSEGHDTQTGYDLYYFDHSRDMEWVTYKEETGSSNPHFDLETGIGYLYANSQTVDLVFTGTAHSTEDVEIELHLTETAPNNGTYNIDLPGWNLVGNPYAVTAYIDIVSEERPFYTMNAGGTAFEAVTGGSIDPMEGIFVIAEEDGETMTFTTTEPQPTEQGKGLALDLSDGRNVIDRAIVRFNKGRTLPKLMLFKNSTKVYIPMDGQDYAVVRSEEVGEMPVNFKAEDNGTYTLSLSVDNIQFGYLHLIDNMTGADIDLLQTPSYSFEAKSTDYASRFKLVFATGDNSNSDSFAFFSNGSFVINNEGNATLQVIDVTGRIIKSQSINGSANVNVNAAPGVYMLRLVNGDNVKVQKVVVK